MEQQQLKGARAAAAAWAALTPEEQEAATKEAEERRAAEAAELAARFKILPTSEDMKRLYDVAAQIAVVEQCDVLTDRMCDCYGTQMSDLLDDADEVFAEQDPEGYCDTSDLTPLQAMNEEALFEESFRVRKEAIRALVVFAERHIVLSWGWDPWHYFEDTLRAYDVARSAVAALGRVECAEQDAEQEVSPVRQRIIELSTPVP